MAKSRELTAPDISNAARTVVGEEGFQQIIASLDRREKITDDKGEEIPFTGATKREFIKACKAAYPVIKKTYEGMNELGRVLPEIRSKLKPLGVYHAWLAFINLSKRTAQNYVQVYDRYREHLPEFAHLGIRKLLIASRLEDCTDYVAKNLPRIEEQTTSEFQTEIRSVLEKADKVKKRSGRPPSQVFKFPDCTVRGSSKGDKITIEGLTKDTQAKLITTLKVLLSQDKERSGHGGRRQYDDPLTGPAAAVGTAERSGLQSTDGKRGMNHPGTENVIPVEAGNQTGADS